MPSDSSAPSWPLVGRVEELSIARASFREHHGVVVLGEAGAGKTRLASELVSESVATGVVWLSEQRFELGAFDAAESALGAEPVQQRDFQLTGSQDLTVVRE